MALTSALNNAFSGIVVSSRRAEVISDNIANAMTEGFARRELNVSSDVLNGYGGGARVDNISRAENLALTSSRREADAEASATKPKSDYMAQFSRAIGEPGDPLSFASRYANFEASLIEAANDPSNEIFLSRVVQNGKNITTSFQGISEEIDTLRLRADGAIADQVEVLNTSLIAIDDLNTEIQARAAAGGSTASLIDQRSLLIDDINEIVPVKVYDRGNDKIALFTNDGAPLVDNFVTEFSFSPVAAMDRSMTIGGGALSSLVVNGQAVGANVAGSTYGGGGLGAFFELRDSLLPTAGSELDGLAVDLISRFQDPSVDTTLTATDTGLFTDAGLQLVAGNETGLAGRLSLNSIVDPDAGGNLWSLRSGLGAAAPGPVGDGTILANLRDSFQATTTPSAGMSAVSSKDAAGFAEFFASGSLDQSTRLVDQLAFELSQAEEFMSIELSSVGVDRDAQLQDLIETEQAYAANAKMLSVLDELIDMILEI